MYVMNGIAYAGTALQDMRVSAAKPLDDMMMLVTFASGERRIYDATQLLEYPAFQPLKDEAVFRAASVDHGVVTWMDGEIDIAPETMYANSLPYDEMAM
ncbi:MAG: DUF2442 domain-containing protein [Clostridia bacterium]|nr:DUF2442 domain-containing protein [Clostridia bacterium]